MPRFVVDTGPFIHLEQIGHLPLLARLPALLVPSGVVSELRDTRLRTIIESWPHTQVLTLAPMAKKLSSLKRMGLDRGEIECLRLALDHAPCIFLTDDLAARRSAERLSIEVHGTVGLIAYAARHRWLSLPQAEKALHQLYEKSSLFITFEIIDSAILALRHRL